MLAWAALGNFAAIHEHAERAREYDEEIVVPIVLADERVAEPRAISSGP